jgi:hypothetical protein
MTIRILAEWERHGKTCTYQFYPKGKKQLCGKPAVARVGSKDFVCQEHLEFVRTNHPTPLEEPRPKAKGKK